MRTLEDVVRIERRFARSARIDADLKGTPPLIGYLLQGSVRKALTQMATAQSESNQGAFTWTGPYGGGKSSAALLVGNLVGGGNEGRAIAEKIVGKDLLKVFNQAFPIKGKQWAVVPVTGSRSNIVEAIADAAADALDWSKTEVTKARKSGKLLVEMLLSDTRARSGILLMIDELGKFLEHAVTHDGDVHVLQELAEFSSRSDGRLVVVGILHQAFEQYAGRLARDTRLEWAKVQGRFQDISFLAGADETVALLGRAIEVSNRPKGAVTAASSVAEQVSHRRPADVAALTEALAATWPLNPITSLILGPVSRQRFAQNERSVFGFLTSAEPCGFIEFLKSQKHDSSSKYGPDRLWDYLQANFSVALAGGLEGARFSQATEAIDRAAAKGGALHVAMAKCASVIELFRNGSGLAVTEGILIDAMPDEPPKRIHKVLRELVEWAVLLPRPRLGDYAIFSGSDFELDSALDKERGKISGADLSTLPQRVGLAFAIAKRHYFRSGALRAFSIVLQTIDAHESNAEVVARIVKGTYRGTGLMVLLIADLSMSANQASVRAREIALKLHAGGVIAAVSVALGSSSALLNTASEFFALERISRTHPQLEGDRIARREIAARASNYLGTIRGLIEQALGRAVWWLSPIGKLKNGGMSTIASHLADAAFPMSPILKSELIQRDRLSSNATAAVRELGHAMVLHGDQESLGLTGFPAEMGLYLTVLKATGVHRKVSGKYRFDQPVDGANGRALRAAWDAMCDLGDCSIDQVYEKWVAAPFGMKRGVMPILAMANILARRDRLVVYVDGEFQSQLTDLLFDKLFQSPKSIRVCKAERNASETRMLMSLAGGLALDSSATALQVAKSIYRRFEALPPYAQRTHQLPEQIKEIRAVILRSKDPEALLFRELPKIKVHGDHARAILNAITEAEQAYPTLLASLRSGLATALGADPNTFSGLARRVDIVRGLTNDLRFEAFAMRAASFEGATGDIEGLASMLVHKPVTAWSDRDREQSFLELARLGRQFREMEVLAKVRKRPSTMEAVALVVGLDPKVPALIRRLELTANERGQADRLAIKVLSAMKSDSRSNTIRLAALARAVENVAGKMEAV